MTFLQSFGPPLHFVVGIVASTACLLLIFYLQDADIKKYGFPYTQPSYNWTEFQRFYPIAAEDILSLPTGPVHSFEPIQYSFLEDNSHAAKNRRSLLRSRARAVRDAFIKSWDSYKTNALLHDELAPISQGWKDTYGGWGVTLVDSLDTLWIMGLKREFYAALRHVALIDWTDESFLSCNIFETTIRYLGGLLSAYDLSFERVLLDKAVDLAEMLLVAFDTPNHMPPSFLVYNLARQGQQLAGSNDASTSPGSLTLEFARLAQLTGESKYYDAVHRVTLFLATVQNTTRLPGMWPERLNFRDQTANGDEFSLGATADSLYEYLLKMDILLGGTEPIYRQMYITAAETARKNMMFRPMVQTKDGKPPDVLFSGSVEVRYPGAEPTLHSEGQHLACFAGGMFALGGRTLNISTHMDVGNRLARGCAWGYSAAPHNILPELFTLAACPSPDSGADCPFDLGVWKDAGGQTNAGPFPSVGDGQYLLRPEAVESLFYMYRITGKEEFQDVAWDMWNSIVNMTKLDDTFAAIENVMVTGAPKPQDSMESFWMSETLKYFYLMFSPPDLISLDDYVFSTEAHPFKRPAS